jgi:hypothetical protein
MGQHDDYGKLVLRRAVGPAYSEWGDSVCVDYGAGQPARIDGSVGASVAVEVESRTSKQVRGAVLDLISHKHPKKLLVLIPMYMHDATITAEQCRFILSRFVDPADFRVVVLNGTGNVPRLESDTTLVRAALAELGWPPRKLSAQSE